MSHKTKTVGSRKNLGRRLLNWLLQGLLLVTLLTLLHLWQTRHAASGDAPPLTGRTLSGEFFDLSAQADTPIIVHFWATWCPVCRLELDNLADLYPQYPLISVAMLSGTETDVQAFLQPRGLQLPVINDPQGRLAKSWGVTGVPATFIVDSGKQISFVEVGYTSGLGLRMRYWWAK